MNKRRPPTTEEHALVERARAAESREQSRSAQLNEALDHMEMQRDDCAAALLKALDLEAR